MDLEQGLWMRDMGKNVAWQSRGRNATVHLCARTSSVLTAHHTEMHRHSPSSLLTAAIIEKYIYEYSYFPPSQSPARFPIYHHLLQYTPRPIILLSPLANGVLVSWDSCSGALF